MYARSTTITGNPAAIDAGIAFIRDEAMPLITAMDGCVGLSLVVDRETGRCIATSSWETQEAMRATDDRISAVRSRAGEILGGEAEVEEWEVAIMHRSHRTQDGACCRIVWAESPSLDESLAMFRETLLSRIEAAEGFCSASMLVDRERGRSCATVTFDTREALDSSREMARENRDRVARETDTVFVDVAEFDLELAHLRVPELV